VSCFRSTIQQVLSEHGRAVLPWLAVQLPGPVYQAAWQALDKVITCGTPQAGGARLYCEACGHLHMLYFTCKSRLCPSCGYQQAQRLTESLRARLIRCRYRHLVCCVPAELRELFFWRRELLPLVCHAAAKAVMAFFDKRCAQHRLLPGIVATCHTFGRNLAFHVHAHLLVTEGGLQVGGLWQPVKFFPATQLRKLWQYHLLTALRQALPADDPWQRRIGPLFRQYQGFIVNVETSYRNVDAALGYCCRYIARPPIGENRIIQYDGTHVTFQFKDYRTGAQSQRRCTVREFIFLLLQHLPPRYARNIHYYGLYRPQVRRGLYAQVRQASRYPQNVVDVPVRHLSWRERIMLAFQVDPVACPQCGQPMVVQEVYLPPARFPPGRRGGQPPDPRQLTLVLA
jgi:hypothetical protein